MNIPNGLRITHLLDKHGNVSPLQLDPNIRLVGIFFSAGWCHPCLSFSNLLKDVYFQVNESIHVFEIVNVSKDETEQELLNYLQHVPWKAIPFHQRDIIDSLSAYFSIEDVGIPVLVLYDPLTQTIVSKKGIDSLRDNPSGFPWTPKPLSSFLEGFLPSHNRHLALYIGAQWHPQSMEFNRKVWNLAESHRNSLDIIYVSRDYSQTVYEQFIAQYPFPAIHFSDQRSSQIIESCEIVYLPCLVYLSSDRNRIIGHRGIQDSLEIPEFI